MTDLNEIRELLAITAQQQVEASRRMDRIEAMQDAFITGLERERLAISEMRVAMIDSFRDTFDLVGVMAQQVESNTNRLQTLEAERQDTNQRFENLLADARADRLSHANRFQAMQELLQSHLLEIQRLWAEVQRIWQRIAG